MKISSLLPLPALLIFALTFGSTAQAGSSDTKHGSYMITTRAGSDSDSDSTNFSSRYAKTVWITPADDPALGVNRIVISLPDQRLYAFHDQQLVGWSTISSGRSGHETPTGSFAVSEKDIDHHSNLYDNAPMPYFMRLTDEGVGMHAGYLPGYPASHGCVRLPEDMAHTLFDTIPSGTPVEITDSSRKDSLTQIAPKPPTAPAAAPTTSPAATPVAKTGNGAVTPSATSPPPAPVAKMPAGNGAVTPSVTTPTPAPVAKQ